MYSCKTCTATFSEHNSYNAHVKQCSLTAKIHAVNGVFTITRDANHAFTCQCSHPGCPRQYQSACGMQKHLKATQHNWRVDSLVGSSTIGGAQYCD